jgi:hypothetical protein
MYDIRKTTILIDEVHQEAGREDGKPLGRVVMMAAVTNPLIGRRARVGVFGAVAPLLRTGSRRQRQEMPSRLSKSRSKKLLSLMNRL